jgi:uncharacterized protein
MNQNLPVEATHVPLTPEEFDKLDAILDDLRTRFDETPQWEFCDGFLTALVCCRRFIPDSESWPVLLAIGSDDGSDEGSFVDEAQRERFSELWLRRYESVALALDTEVQRLDDERAFQPEVVDMRANVAALPPEERSELDGVPVPSFSQIWAIGFMYAVESWPEEWTAPRDRQAAKVLDAALQCIVALTEDDTQAPTVSAFEEDGDPTVSEQRLNDFADAIWAVYDLRVLWRNVGPRVETVYKTATPGRNDPCFCGSGKKYKKCCGLN